MLNHQGYVAEGTGINCFIVKNGVVRTPHPSCGILQGITRDTVISALRKEGYAVEETFLTVYDVATADEAFFCGTAAEVIGFVSLDGTKIGCGTPGKVTVLAMQLFKEAIKSGVEF
jgi:branched-chain amino acid aminotransferase